MSNPAAFAAVEQICIYRRSEASVGFRPTVIIPERYSTAVISRRLSI